MPEKIIQSAKVKGGGEIFYRNVQLLDYVNGQLISLDSTTPSLVLLSTVRTNKRSGWIGRTRTRRSISSNETNGQRFRSHVTLESHNDVVENFFQEPASTLTTMEALKSHAESLSSSCYFGLCRQLETKVLSRRTKTKLYKSPIVPFLPHYTELWTDKPALLVS